MRSNHRIFFILLFLAVVPFITQCARVGSGNENLNARPSDKPIIPIYTSKGEGVRAWLESAPDHRYRLSALPGSFIKSDGTPGALRVAVYTVSAAWAQAAMWSQEKLMIEGSFIREVATEVDGSINNAELIIPQPLDYLLLIPFDVVGGNVPVPVDVQLPNGALLKAPISAEGIGVFENVSRSAAKNVWTSPAAIKKLKTTHPGFQVVRTNANRAIPASDLTSQFSRVDIDLMAAAMVNSAMGNVAMREKVLLVLNDLMAKGQPEGVVDYWVTNIVGYIVAADLIGYRTPAFETYLKNISDVWVGPTLAFGDQTMRSLWRRAANQRIGMQTATALAAIDAYLGRKENLAQLAQELTALLENRSQMPGLTWKKYPWQADLNAPFYINPPGSTVMCNGVAVDISNIIPNLMTNTSPCDPANNPSGEHWKTVEGWVSVMRILERQGFSLWFKGSKAILRVADTLRNRYQVGIESYPGLVWIYWIMDKAYGTTATCQIANLPDGQRWGAGASVGWPWVESAWEQTCPAPG